MNAPLWIGALALAITSAATLLSIVAVFRVTTRRRRLRALRAVAAHGAPPVTVLKPLCGADDDLEANLASFFNLDYPAYELIFGVEGASDPAIAVVRRLIGRHPRARARLVVHAGGGGLNPKVSNLRAMLRAAGAEDLIVVSDSNVRVAPDWLTLMVGERLAGDRVGLVTNLFVGTGERTLGAALDNLHLAGPVAGSVAFTGAFGGGDRAVSVGKSMLLSRRDLDALGGLASLSPVLAEDYVMGQMFANGGYAVRLAPSVVVNVCARASVGRFLARHLRWGLIRSRLTPLRYLAEPFFSPMAVALGAASLGVPPAVCAAVGIGATVLRDALQWVRLRGPKGLAKALLLGPLKELVLVGVWAVAPLTSRVGWRGKHFRVAMGTRLYADRPLPRVP